MSMWSAAIVEFGRREPTWCLRCGRDIDTGAIWCGDCHPVTGRASGDWEHWQHECQEDAARVAEYIGDRQLLGLWCVMALVTGLNRANQVWLQVMAL